MVESGQLKKPIVLKVVEARDLPYPSSGTVEPNAFVKLVAANFKAKTATFTNNRSPFWNEEFTIPPLDRSAILTLQVYHQCQHGLEDFLGAADIDVDALLGRQGYGRPIELQLEHENSNGVLVIEVKERKPQCATSIALDQTCHVGHPWLATIVDSDTVAPLIQLVPHLAPFIEVADRITTWRPYANLAWQVTSLVITIPKGLFDCHRGILELIGTMEHLYSYLARIGGQNTKSLFEKIVQQTLTQTIECAYFIRRYTKCYSTTAVMSPPSSGAALKIVEFQEAFLTLERQFLGAGNVQTALVTGRIPGTTKDVRLDQLIDRLKPFRISTDGHPPCLPSTRLDVIKAITAWITNENSPQTVFWLYGPSGCGKRAISITVADIFRDLQRLGAFISFDRDVAERRDPKTLIRTLAYRLAMFDVRLGRAVALAVKSAPSIMECSLGYQFRKLLIEPLQSLEPNEFGGPILIIVGALDDAKDRPGLLRVLSRAIGELPRFIRILITSQRESDIDNAVQSHPMILPCDLDVMLRSTSSDIKCFITTQMEHIRKSKLGLGLPSDWPRPDKVSALAKTCGGLFICASAACTFIARGPDPRVQMDELDRVFPSPPLSALHTLDLLYKTELRNASDWRNDTFRSGCLAILGLILVAQVPLSPISIDDILCLPRPSLPTIERLGSVIHGHEDGTVRVLHSSWRDFLSDRNRSGADDWFIDINLNHGRMATRCLQMLEKKLKKNICDLTAGETFEAPALPESLSYASLYWIDHICSTTDIDIYTEATYSFLSKRLLQWLEVMSLQKAWWRAIRQLRELAKRIRQAHHDELCRLLYDAERFAQFFADCCEKHPLLIYSTALSFCPKDTTISKMFQSDRVLQVIGGAERWPPLLLQLHGHAGPVCSIAVAHDGSQIVSGSADRTIRIWDAITGVQILPPLRGHNNTIMSVAISPDGTMVASGSVDKTIRVWDTNCGTQILPPLEGHTDTVNSVAFTLNGSEIISGSSDKTIRVWSLNTGTQRLPPIRGHSSDIRSVAVLPDGSKIVSGSKDRTVRIWDARTGAPFFPLLRGHRGSVESVAVTRDGGKVVSGSFDHIIRVWDICTAQCVSSLRCNGGPVCCIALTPDNSDIVSGSSDFAIRIWKADSDFRTHLTLQRHRGRISSVALTPDSKVVSASVDGTICIWDVNAAAEGQAQLYRDSEVPTSTLKSRRTKSRDVTAQYQTAPKCFTLTTDSSRIASGSSDGTIRFWDTSTGNQVLPPLRGHAGAVTSITFSYDGLKIASGSEDHTIRLWDAGTGSQILAPFRGHSGTVCCVAFTHDGLKLVSASSDRTIRIWDASTGVQILSPIQGPELNYSSVAIAPDASRIVSVHNSEMIHVWNAKTGTRSLRIDSISPVESVAFTSDGSKVVSHISSGRKLIWHVDNGVKAQSLPRETDLPDTVKDALLTSTVLVRWLRGILHVPTRQFAALPTALPIYHLRIHNSKLIGWTGEHQPVIVEFRDM